MHTSTWSFLWIKKAKWGTAPYSIEVWFPRSPLNPPTPGRQEVRGGTLEMKVQKSATAATASPAQMKWSELCFQQILIDMREFRSTLPFLLHKTGIEITPLTLEVATIVGVEMRWVKMVVVGWRLHIDTRFVCGEEEHKRFDWISQFWTIASLNTG